MVHQSLVQKQVELNLKTDNGFCPVWQFKCNLCDVHILPNEGGCVSGNGSTCWPALSMTCNALSYLLPKSLSPVKDLAQPVSFSSTTQIGGDNKEWSMTEEGSEEWEDEDAELNSPSLPFTVSNASVAVSKPVAPVQASKTAPVLRSVSVSPSGSMMDGCCHILLAALLVVEISVCSKFPRVPRKNTANMPLN